MHREIHVSSTVLAISLCIRVRHCLLSRFRMSFDGLGDLRQLNVWLWVWCYKTEKECDVWWVVQFVNQRCTMRLHTGGSRLGGGTWPTRVLGRCTSSCSSSGGRSLPRLRIRRTRFRTGGSLPWPPYRLDRRPGTAQLREWRSRGTSVACTRRCIRSSTQGRHRRTGTRSNRHLRQTRLSCMWSRAIARPRRCVAPRSQQERHTTQ